MAAAPGQVTPRAADTISFFFFSFLGWIQDSGFAFFPPLLHGLGWDGPTSSR